MITLTPFQSTQGTPRGRRRGAALLFVLAALALLMPVCLGLSRTVATAGLSKRVEEDVRLVEDLLIAADGPIQEWLADEAGSLVLAPDAPYPAALVLHDRFDSNGVDRELTIVAWDQLGLVPLALTRSASPLRLTLPRDVTARLDQGPRDEEYPGLDWFVGGAEGGKSHSESPFPPRPEVLLSGEECELRWPSSSSTRVGMSIATHGSGAINVSTAPAPVVDAALRELGRGGLDLILDARRKGESAPVPPARATARRDERPAFELASSSDCFAFRIDARAGRASRSWWSIYRLQEGKWRLEQRLLITGD